MQPFATWPVGEETFVLRRAVRTDVPAIVALLAADQLGATRHGGPGADLRPYRQAFDAITADPAHLLLVVTTADDTVVGTMQLSFIPGMARRGALRAQIEAVRVAADQRSRGLGKAMFDCAIGAARRRDAPWCS
jgi:ribosomal protein S18 acetylase RimI-like enzyme